MDFIWNCRKNILFLSSVIAPQLFTGVLYAVECEKSPDTCRRIEREKNPPLQWRPQHTRTETHASCLRQKEYYYYFLSPHHGIGSHSIIIILRSVLGRLQRLFPQFASILRGEQHSVIEIAHTNRIYFVLFV